MKKVILMSLLISVISLISSCKKDDENITNNSSTEHPEIIGSWKRNVHWGSIDGTMKITFSSNSTYSVELERIEDYNGPCSLDPYCDNDYSGDYWFDGNALYYNHSTLGWTDSWSTWSVQGNLLNLDNYIYTKQ